MISRSLARRPSIFSDESCDRLLTCSSTCYSCPLRCYASIIVLKLKESSLERYLQALVWSRRSFFNFAWARSSSTSRVTRSHLAAAWVSSRLLQCEIKSLLSFSALWRSSFSSFFFCLRLTASASERQICFCKSAISSTIPWRSELRCSFH